MPLKEVISLLRYSNKYRDVYIVTIIMFFLFILAFLINNSNSITSFAIINYSSGGCSDLDFDGKVTLRDLNLLQNNLKKSKVDPSYNDQMDFDNNNYIDKSDLACLQSDFGRSLNCPRDSKVCGCLQGCYDLNSDGKVSVLDLAILSKLSGSCIGNDNYNPNADFDANGCISYHQLSQDYMCLQNNMGKKSLCGYNKYGGACPDIDNDKQVTNKDVDHLIKLRGSTVKDQEFDPRLDFNDDGIINDIDNACIEDLEGSKIKCPENSNYCGCFNGCPDINGDGLVSITDISIYNKLTGTCKGDPEYNEMLDFDKDKCIESNKAELDFLCMDYYLGQEIYCNINPLNQQLKLSNIDNVQILVAKKSNTKILFKSSNNEILGVFDVQNGIYYDKIKFQEKKALHLEIIGENPNIKEGTIKLFIDKSIINLYIPKIEKVPIKLFFGINGESYFDPNLEKIAADESSKFVDLSQSVVNYSPPKCNQISCFLKIFIKDYYLHLLVIFAIIIGIHVFNKKKHL